MSTLIFGEVIHPFKRDTRLVDNYLDKLSILSDSMPKVDLKGSNTVTLLNDKPLKDQIIYNNYIRSKKRLNKILKG
jgi:hypothetical protein